MADNENNNGDGINREYKDRLFKFIFGNPNHKEWALDVFNTLGNTNYTDADAVEFTTIEDVVYLGMKNDVSFLFGGIMSFYEQQSKVDRTLPVRFLSYSSMVYNKHIERSWNVDGHFPKKFPIPICVCFYNGTLNQPDRLELKFSDLFTETPLPYAIKPSIEITVTVFNVNSGRNKELLDKCKPLADYSWFVGRTRFNQTRTNTKEEAVDLTLKEMPNDSVLKQFLLENQAEVKSMWITEYNEERAHAQSREEGYEEGREEGFDEGVSVGEARGINIGREQGLIEGIAGFVKSGVITLAQAAERFEMTEAEFAEKAAALEINVY